MINVIDEFMRRVALCVWAFIGAPCAFADAPSDLSGQSLEELVNTGLSTPPKNVTVATASKYRQDSSRAPSALRVVTAEDIRTYGYRTLVDVIRSLPGVYVSNDRNFINIGVRGFDRAGDYNSRVLLMIDGERSNENVYDSAYVDNGFLLDVDLIDRVEFIPGPGSAIYGNNAFFGVINVITKSGKDFNGSEMSGEYRSFDTYKARGSYGKRFDNGAELLLSATGFDRGGPDKLYYPEFDTPTQNNGVAEQLDSDRNQSAFGKFSWGPVTLEGGHNRQNKAIPTANFGQTFNDPQTHIENGLSFVTLTYEDRIAQDWIAHTRLNWHRYDFLGDYVYGPPRTVTRSTSAGESAGGDFQLANTSFSGHKLIFGVEFQDNLRQNQDIFMSGRTDTNHSHRYGIYLQDEYRITGKLTFTAGARYDYISYGYSSANPRLALIWQALDSTTAKLVYGTAFRAPNIYERYYMDDSTKINPQLRQEETKTLELILEHFLNTSTRISASIYRYELKNLMRLTHDPQDRLAVFENQGPITAYGAELEGERRFRNGIRARVSYVWQHAAYDAGQTLSNSPQHQAKLNVSLPLRDDRWRIGFETQYMGGRYTKDGKVGDYALGNLTISGDFTRNFGVSAGVYNLWDSKYADPGGADLRQDSIIQDGINFRLKLSLRF